MRLRRNASLAVENPAGFPTARGFAHSLHSGSYQCFKKPGNNPELSTGGWGIFNAHNWGNLNAP
jgi:hypothetical protein